jgi:hypothetical protein
MSKYIISLTLLVLLPVAEWTKAESLEPTSSGRPIEKRLKKHQEPPKQQQCGDRQSEEKDRLIGKQLTANLNGRSQNSAGSFFCFKDQPSGPSTGLVPGHHCFGSSERAD